MADKKLRDKLLIRGLEISPPIALAPMVGLSHSALRSLVQEEGGIGLLFTEMLSAGRLQHDNKLISPLLIRHSSEHPLFYQIATADEHTIDLAVERLHDFGAQGIDLNLGCPAPLLRKQGAGLALSQNTRLMVQILRRLRRCTDLPVSVKIRLGNDLAGEDARNLCRLLEDSGIDLITIHARLNGEKFCRKPRWSVVGKFRHAIGIPILINGGIFSTEEAKCSLEQSGADGIMVGRGAAEKPWLCAEIAQKLYGHTVNFKKRSSLETYCRFIDLLEQRFTPERRLGRLKQFTTYFAATYLFGHHFSSAVQSSASIDQAKQRALKFFNKTLN